MPTNLYSNSLAELRAQHPDTHESRVTYQVGREFFDAQKDVETEGALKGFTSVIVIAQDGKIVLARKPYGPPGWSLPGGGVELDETFAQAAEREILEEVGVRLEDLELLMIEEETFVSPDGGKTHSLLGVFAGSMNKFALPPLTEGAKEEGLELKLFDPDDLPDEMTLTDRDKIELFLLSEGEESEDDSQS